VAKFNSSVKQANWPEWSGNEQASWTPEPSKSLQWNAENTHSFTGPSTQPKKTSFPLEGILKPFWTKFNTRAQATPESSEERVLNNDLKDDVVSIQQSPGTFTPASSSDLTHTYGALKSIAPQIIPLISRLRDKNARGCVGVTLPKKSSQPVEVNADTIKNCNANGETGLCEGCRTHLQQLADSWTGLMENNPETNHLHIKNLLTGIHNYKTHILKHGLDATSYTDPTYDNCADNHGAVVKALHQNYTDLLRGYQDDGFHHSNGRLQRF